MGESGRAFGLRQVGVEIIGELDLADRRRDGGHRDPGGVERPFGFRDLLVVEGDDVGAPGAPEVKPTKPEIAEQGDLLSQVGAGLVGKAGQGPGHRRRARHGHAMRFAHR